MRFNIKNGRFFLDAFGEILSMKGIECSSPSSDEPLIPKMSVIIKPIELSGIVTYTDIDNIVIETKNQKKYRLTHIELANGLNIFLKEHKLLQSLSPLTRAKISRPTPQPIESPVPSFFSDILNIALMASGALLLLKLFQNVTNQTEFSITLD